MELPTLQGEAPHPSLSQYEANVQVLGFCQLSSSTIIRIFGVNSRPIPSLRRNRIQILVRPGVSPELIDQVLIRLLHADRVDEARRRVLPEAIHAAGFLLLFLFLFLFLKKRKEESRNKI